MISIMLWIVRFSEDLQDDLQYEGENDELQSISNVIWINKLDIYKISPFDNSEVTQNTTLEKSKAIIVSNKMYVLIIFD